jgi:hypothetical protein
VSRKKYYRRQKTISQNIVFKTAFGGAKRKEYKGYNFIA